MTVKVSLPEEFGAFVDDQVTSGRYASADEVVREALRLMERHLRDAARVAWLQQAYREGIESGFDEGPLDFEAIKAEGRKRLAKSTR